MRENGLAVASRQARIKSLFGRLGFVLKDGLKDVAKAEVGRTSAVRHERSVDDRNETGSDEDHGKQSVGRLTSQRG